MVKHDVKEAMKKMDAIYNVTPPNKPTLSIILEKKIRQHKQRQKRELILFILVAIAIIFVLLALLTKLPLVYFIVQIIGVILVPLVEWRSKKWRDCEESIL